MSLFDKMFSRKKESQPEKRDSAKMIEVMLLQAELFLEDGKDDWAVEQYKSILNLCSSATAQYNLGRICARALITSGRLRKTEMLQPRRWCANASLTI